MGDPPPWERVDDARNTVAWRDHVREAQAFRFCYGTRTNPAD